MGPALAFWILANGVPWFGGEPFVVSFFLTATYHNPPDVVFPITYGCAVALCPFTAWVLSGLSWPRRVLVAIAVPFAFTHLYEVPYDLIGYYVWYPNYDWAVWPETLFLNASWLALGVSTFPFWKLRWKGALALGGFIGTFLAWWIWFLPFIPPVVQYRNPEGMGFIVSKVILAILVACLIWDGRPTATRDGPPIRDSYSEPPPADSVDPARSTRTRVRVMMGSLPSVSMSVPKRLRSERRRTRPEASAASPAMKGRRLSGVHRAIPSWLSGRSARPRIWAMSCQVARRGSRAGRWRWSAFLSPVPSAAWSNVAVRPKGKVLRRSDPPSVRQ